MKKQLLWCMAALSFSAASAQTYETRFARPLSDVLNDVAARFQVRLKYDIDTVGRILPYADFRIRPYSLEETLTNVLSPFDYKFVKQSDTVYKLKPYEYARRTDVDGEKMLSYLSGLYTDKDQWEQEFCLVQGVTSFLRDGAGLLKMEVLSLAGSSYSVGSPRSKRYAGSPT